MKPLVFIIALFCSVPAFSQEVFFEILKKETTVDSDGAISLRVNVVNNSTKSIAILKPATSSNEKWRNYTCDMLFCENSVLWMSSEEILKEFKEDDLLVVPPKSSMQIILNGRFNANGCLSCQSNKFKLKIKYDATSLINQNELTPEEKNILNKLSQITVESEIVMIKLKKSKV
jgi:hypothetical protein